MPSKNSFYLRDELCRLGFLSIGANVLISRKASIYSPDKISLGSNIRVDDYCILSGAMTIGDYVHIAAYSAIYGGGAGVSIGSFVNISSRVTIYAVSDDFSGNSLTGPLIPDEYKDMIHKEVVIRNHVIIGATSVVLPGALLDEGSAFGTFSLINNTYPEWSVNVGIPCKTVKCRSRNLIELQQQFLDGQDCE